MVEPVDDVDVVNGFGVWRVESDDLDGFFSVDENRHDNEFGGHQTTGTVAVVGQQVGNIVDGFVFEERENAAAFAFVEIFEHVRRFVARDFVGDGGGHVVRKLEEDIHHELFVVEGKEHFGSAFWLHDLDQSGLRLPVFQRFDVFSDVFRMLFF